MCPSFEDFLFANAVDAEIAAKGDFYDPPEAEPESGTKDTLREALFAEMKSYEKLDKASSDKELEKMVNDILNTESVKTLRTIPESVKDDIIFAELDLQINRDSQAEEYYTGRINKDNIDEILKLIDTYNKEVEANPLVFKAEDLLGRYGTEDDESAEMVYTEETDYVFGYLNIYYNVNDEEKDPYGPTEPSLSMNVPEEYAESIELLRELCEKYPQA